MPLRLFLSKTRVQQLGGTVAALEAAARASTELEVRLYPTPIHVVRPGGVA